MSAQKRYPDELWAGSVRLSRQAIKVDSTRAFWVPELLKFLAEGR